LEETNVYDSLDDKGLKNYGFILFPDHFPDTVKLQKNSLNPL